jgi:hypothetical protein
LRLTGLCLAAAFPGSDVDNAAFYNRGTEATEDTEDGYVKTKKAVLRVLCGLCASVLKTAGDVGWRMSS